jgi:hypothetical protein
MQAAWGSTRLPVNGAEVTSQLSVVEQTDYGAPLRSLVAYNVVVWLTGESQSDLSLQELTLRAALARPNQDFILYTDSGATSSASILVSATATGTRCVSITTPEAQGAEFVNRRTVGFTVTAEYHVANMDRAVISWQERLTIIGNGGPRRVWRFPVNGPAIRQVMTPYSLVRAIQQGHAVGYRVRPTKPAPLFPDYLVNEGVAAIIDTPKYIGAGQYVNWPVSWSYTFERGDGPLAGVTALPPGVLA